MNDLEKILNFKHLYKGLKSSCRNVRWKNSTVAYEFNGLKNTYNLKKDILSGRYKLQPYQTFTIYEPKKRTIVATRIRDRQFQHAMVDEVVYEQLTKSFIADNCACLRGRGVDYCLDRITKHLRSYYKKHGDAGWVLRCDIRHYFESIPHKYAKQIIRKKVKDTKIQAELFRIINSYPGDCGLGLGSQVNQLIASAILDDLDHYIKEKLKIKYYVRYMDDFLLIHEDKEYLKKCKLIIEKRINDLELSFNKDKTVLLPLSQGFEMLKWKFMLKPSGRIIRRMRRNKIIRQKKKIYKLYVLECSGKRKKGTCDQSMMCFIANTKRGDTYSERREIAEYYHKLSRRKFHDYVKYRRTTGKTGSNCSQ